MSGRAVAPAGCGPSTREQQRAGRSAIVVHAPETGEEVAASRRSELRWSSASCLESSPSWERHGFVTDSRKIGTFRFIFSPKSTILFVAKPKWTSCERWMDQFQVDLETNQWTTAIQVGLAASVLAPTQPYSSANLSRLSKCICWLSSKDLIFEIDVLQQIWCCHHIFQNPQFCLLTNRGERHLKDEWINSKLI